MENIKKAKFHVMRREFEVICMKESDTIDSFFTQLIRLVTQMRSHGEIIEERRIVEKVLRILPSRFDVILTTIEEKNDLSMFIVDELYASLITHEDKDLLKSNKKKDSKALFYLNQAIHESIFPRIASVKKYKEAWDTLQTAYQGMEKVNTTKLQLDRKSVV